MKIKTCKQCPFYQETLVSLLSSRGGLCGYDVATDALIRPDIHQPQSDVVLQDLRLRSAKRRAVPDPKIMPEWCPLRERPVTIEFERG